MPAPKSIDELRGRLSELLPSEESLTLAQQLRRLGANPALWPHAKPWPEVAREYIRNSIPHDTAYNAKCAAITNDDVDRVSLPWLKTSWGSLLLEVVEAPPSAVADGDEEPVSTIELYFDALQSWNSADPNLDDSNPFEYLTDLLIWVFEEFYSGEICEGGSFAIGGLMFWGSGETLQQKFSAFCDAVEGGLLDRCAYVVDRYLEDQSGPIAALDTLLN